MSPITVERADPRTPDCVRMIAALDAAMTALYQPAACHFLTAEQLAEEGADVFVARQDERAVGMGALIPRTEQAFEIKRMWTEPAARRRGVALALLRTIEARSRERGAAVLHLETGVLQPQAVALYEREGFVRCAAFPPYDENEDLIFMEKRLDQAAHAAQ